VLILSRLGASGFRLTKFCTVEFDPSELLDCSSDVIPFDFSLLEEFLHFEKGSKSSVVETLEHCFV
jgi:hypothetical protein